MEITRCTTRGWIKPKGGAKYGGGVSLRVFRRWLREGLPHVRKQVGERKKKGGGVEPVYRIFVRYDDIDAWMEQDRVTDTSTTDLADELTRGLT